MNEDYHQIEKVIQFYLKNSREHFDPEKAASHLGLDSSQLKKLFEEWAGADPAVFFKCLKPAFIKSQMDGAVTLFDYMFDGEKSEPEISPDRYVKIEPIKPADLQNGLKIFYSSAQTMYGDILIASSEKGICYVSFIDQPASGVDLLKRAFPGSFVINEQHGFHKEALRFFQEKAGDSDWNRLKLHIKGTPFQLSVWRALLTLSKGELTTYGDLAHKIGRSKASRAVGSAVGKNPVAFIIPCHRVIASTGLIGNYRWGPVRKAAMVGRELAQKEKVHLRNEK